MEASVQSHGHAVLPPGKEPQVMAEQETLRATAPPLVTEKIWCEPEPKLKYLLSYAGSRITRRKGLKYLVKQKVKLNFTVE
jgi:hypothetical protein